MGDISRLLDNLNVLIGIEEEVFIVNSKGFLAPHAEMVSAELIRLLREDEFLLKKTANRLMGLQWEPNPSQIEYVTRPMELDKVEETVSFARKLLAMAADRISCKIYTGSVHPVQSSPFPINGMHVSISIFKRKKKRPTIKTIQYVHNHVRNHLPEIIALTANSPVVAGRYIGYASARLFFSRVLVPSNYAVVKHVPMSFIPREKRSVFRYIVIFERNQKKKVARIIAHRHGLRLLDITPRGPFTNIIEDFSKSRRESRVEIRAIDIQSSVQSLSDIVKIMVALSIEAISKLVKGEKIGERPNMIENRNRAIKNGINAMFLKENGGEISARESVLNMIERVETVLDEMGLKLKSSLRKAVPETERFPKIIIKDDYPELFELIDKGRTIVRVKTDRKSLIPVNYNKEREKIDKKYLTGIVFADYTLDWQEEDNIVQRFTKITRNYWLMTLEGYVKINKKDKIIGARNPITQLYVILKKMNERDNEKVNES